MEQFFNQEDFLKVILLAIPLVVGGIVHMAVVKSNALSYLKKPIHKRLFGENKTWRGFVVMPLATYPGVVIAQKIESYSDLTTPLLMSHSAILLSLVLGICYCLAELPNSYVKRRLGIKEGLTSERHKWFFIIMDQADSVIGCMLGYLVFISLPLKIILPAMLFGVVIHLLINNVLYFLGLRKNPL